jgi:outer membrane receptor for ferric coprogen and ferric-rhodotorulic acid
MPTFPYAGNLIPEPVWGALSEYDDHDEGRKRVFGSTRLVLTDKLKAILGINYAQYHRDGNSSGLIFDQTDSKVSPYAGLTYDITNRVLGYVSYSDLYFPQSQVDADNEYLDPSKGTNIEAGVKTDWLDKRLLTTLAVFRAKQSGLATPTGDFNSFGQFIYTPVDVQSKGIELEATGKLNDYSDLVFGYTTLKLTGQDGDDTYPWVPRHTANLALRARVPSYTALSFGASGRWQSEISNVESSGITVRQDAYTVLNAFAAWQFLPDATLRFNVNNLTDEKYINTLRYAGYYGAPRNYQATLDYKF